MRIRDIEIWALQVLDRVQNKQPIEDARVELKAIWPLDVPKTARQIAAHANTARGESLLWLIGVDEHDGVKGVNFQDFATWFPPIQKEFDGLAPTLTEVNVPFEGKTIAALYFETERIPFVVKNPVHNTPGGGPVQWEVPWRGSTTTRTARREELLLLLAPLSRLPSVEILSGYARLMHFVQNESPFQLAINLQLYLVPKDTNRIVIPFHHCDLAFEINGVMPMTLIDSPNITAPITWLNNMKDSRPASQTMFHSRTELICLGPGSFTIQGYLPIDHPIDSWEKTSAAVRFRFRPAGIDQSVDVRFELPPSMREKWSLGETVLAAWQYDEDISTPYGG